MDCLTTKKCFKWNKDKRIGNIIIIVEGESDEFKLLKKVFVDILDYNYFEKKKNKKLKQVNRNNSTSNTIYVFNSANSNIKSILNTDDLYYYLRDDYHEDITNVPVYIIWDRDYDSNDKNDVANSIELYSKYNESSIVDAMLYLSYPCIETYMLSNFDNKLYKKSYISSKKTKSAYKQSRFTLDKIDENTIITSICNMHNSFKKNYNIQSYDLDNIYNINNKVFNAQEIHFAKEKSIMAVSFISILLLNLGIVVETEN